jgi:hypothetical protein
VAGFEVITEATASVLMLGYLVARITGQEADEIQELFDFGEG